MHAASNQHSQQSVNILDVSFVLCSLLFFAPIVWIVGKVALCYAQGMIKGLT